MKQTPEAPASGASLSASASASASAASAQALFQHAIAHHQAGRLHQAEDLYRQILQLMPQHADAWHLLGVIALQGGRFDVASDLIRRAIQIRPADNFHCNLGNALKEQGQRREAITCYRKALALNPDMAEAHCNLGNALLEEGELEAAAASCRRAIVLSPGFAAAHCNLGNALLKLVRPQEAVASYVQALQIAPGLAVAHTNLGHALKDLGHLDEAIACYRQALSIGPVSAELLCSLGRAFKQQGQLALAIDSHVEALKHSDRPEVRAEFVQAVQTAHFQAPQADVRALLIRALEEGWADPGELLTPASSLIEVQPAVQQGIAWSRQAGADPQGPAVPLPPAVLNEIAADRLLLAVLDNDSINSIALERLLTCVRRQMLGEALSAFQGGTAHAVPAALSPSTHLHGAIARQCFINEYVYACSNDEQAQLLQLHSLLDACLADGTLPSALWLLASASYAPLSDLPVAEAWTALPWPAPLAALFTQQVVEPAIERGLRSSIPSLTAIEDPVSRQVQAQYEQNPYPRWTRLPQAAAPGDIDTLLQRQFPGAPLQTRRGPADSASLAVLVAGCGTGQHPIRVARQFKNAQVLALDLSLASLSYARRKTAEAGLNNIEYAQADLLKLGAVAQRFDLIESVGVLHHLADPVAGWRVLLDLLRPGGLMFLGLYSELGRSDVVAARQLLANQSLPSQISDIRRCRQALMSEALAPQFQQFLSSRDFYSTSACRDLLFHVQEHRYTLPQLKATLAQLGLNFIGFVLDRDVTAAYAQQFPDDPARIDLDHWHAFEVARPATFSRMYQFWVQKPCTP